MSESLAKQTEIEFMGMDEITWGKSIVRREKGQELNPEKNPFVKDSEQAWKMYAAE